MNVKLTETELAHMASIVEYSDDAIISKTLDGIILSWNRGAERLYGYTAEEMVGQPMLRLIPEGWADEEPQILERIRRGEVIDHYETVRRAKDGTLIDISVTISPLKDSTGKIIGASKIARNITERKASEREVRRLNQELEGRVSERTRELRTSNEELEAFSYSVSHDLRAPLRSIRSFTELLQAECGPALGETGHGYLERIVQAARRMDALIDDLLTFSKTGRISLTSVPIATRQVVDEVIRDLMEEAKGRRIEWEIGPLPVVEADLGLYKQVWVNLLSNAVKYTRYREIARIRISASETTEAYRFEVADNGAGFDMAYAEKLFQIFERLQPKEFEGTGVGLTHVRRIVERHGGRIWAEGRPDQGAIFRFTLPKYVGRDAASTSSGGGAS